MSVLSIQNLTSPTNSGQTLFNDISLQADGGIIAIVGQSGCGKTTLLRTIAGLTALETGKIYLDNDDITTTSPSKRKVGLVFQNYALFPHLTVLKNVSFGLKNTLNKKKIATKYLKMVSLAHKADAYPSQLSGGQQQRVALVRAIAAKPKVMLLDEPFSGLDCNTRRKVCNETMHLLRQQEIPTLFVTHDLEEAHRVADQVLELKQGKLIPHRQTNQFAKPKTFINSDQTTGNVVSFQQHAKRAV